MTKVVFHIELDIKENHLDWVLEDPHAWLVEVAGFSSSDVSVEVKDD